MVTNLGLMDSNGEIVALDGGSGDTFSDLLGNEIFNIANAADALVAGDTIEVASSGGIDVSTQSAASDAITTLNTAINDVSAERANLGAIQNRLDHTINNLSTTAENMTASESRIRDVDMAKEMMEYTKLGILQQASQAMLAQANQAPQGVLQLLQ
jgi:flagellin